MIDYRMMRQTILYICNKYFGLNQLMQPETNISKPSKLFLAIIAMIAWFAVGLQFYLIILNRVTGVPETIIRFFSFYTILTNILVALYATFLLLKPNTPTGRFLICSGTVTALVTYITLVGLIYNLILRQLWKPEGWQWVADELLHVIVPLLFILFWIIWAKKIGLVWKNIFFWLVYPLVYLFLILIRGAFSGYYPYPFINVKILGYIKVFVNSGGIMITFFVLSGLFVAIAKIMNRQTRKGSTLKA